MSATRTMSGSSAFCDPPAGTSSYLSLAWWVRNAWQYATISRTKRFMCDSPNTMAAATIERIKRYPDFPSKCAQNAHKCFGEVGKQCGLSTYAGQSQTHNPSVLAVWFESCDGGPNAREMIADRLVTHAGD